MLRPVTGLMLSLLLVLTGQAMAVARGAPGSAGRIVVCTGAGPVIIAMDANGRPTDTARYCPDRALALLAAVAMVPARIHRPVGVLHATPAPAALPTAPVPPRTSSSRDPPVTV